MASKAERLITEALGHPDATTTFSTTATTVSGVLQADATYRFVGTEDYHLKISEDNAAATTSDMFMPAGIPEIFTTTANQVVVNALRNSTDGTLFATLLHSRGK